MRVALFAAFVLVFNSADLGSSLANGQSEGAAVAPQPPAFLGVVLQAQVPLEALDAEVNFGLLRVVLGLDLVLETQLLSLSRFTFEHDAEEALHGPH